MNPNGQPYQWPWYQQLQPQAPQTPSLPQQASPLPAMLPGRKVNTPTEIRPNEVPMDGSASYFPTADGQFVFMKQWNSDGTISTAKYTRSDEPVEEMRQGSVSAKAIETTQKADELNAAIIAKLDKIEKMLSKKSSKEGSEQ